MKHLFTLALMGLCGQWALAQDFYFTQFYAAPLDLNPALTGAYEGSFRVGINYREQWNGLVDNPFQTYAVSGDLRFELGEQRTQHDYAGAGVSFTSDRVSFFDYNNTGIRLSGAFHKNLDASTQQYLSGGAYLGLIQRNVNIESLVFDDQFNGLDGYTFGTREGLPENNFAHGDLGVGLNYTVAPSDELRFSGGLAFAHLIQPSLSFFTRSPNFPDAEDIQLFRKTTAYISSEIALTKRSALLPRVAWISQGPHTLINAGAMVKFDINQYNSNTLHLGAGMRMAEQTGSLTPSAFSVLTAIQLDEFLIGLSYDFNMDDVFNERLGQNVFELSISFIGEYDNEATFCPTF